MEKSVQNFRTFTVLYMFFLNVSSKIVHGISVRLSQERHLNQMASSFFLLPEIGLDIFLCKYREKYPSVVICCFCFYYVKCLINF